MTDKTSTNSRSCGRKEIKREGACGQSIKNVECGDLAWVQLHSSSWWPGQVVDDSTISASNRPKRTKAGTVLVRLYGSYEYQYVDPILSSLDFEHALRKYNGKHTGILKECLDRDLHQLQFSKSNQKNMKTNGKKVSDPSQGRISKPNRTNKCQNTKLPCEAAGENEESNCKASERRVKVMRALGLTAPAGSPFKLEGCISSTNSSLD